MLLLIGKNQINNTEVNGIFKYLCEFSVYIKYYNTSKVVLIVNVNDELKDENFPLGKMM